MSLIYVTADSINAKSGGGRVTHEEREALRTLGFVHTLHPRPDLVQPFQQDEDVLYQLKGVAKHTDEAPRLAHVYAGCFTKSVAYLKEIGYKVTYTVAAHDVGLSRKAHEELGCGFPYPHLTDPAQFNHYSSGYVNLADVVIVPGSCAEITIRAQGRTRRIVRIPHGCDVPEAVTYPTSHRPFVVGYLGAVGPDKGLLTLARAWQHYATVHAHSGGHKLLIGGRNSLSALPLFRHVCGMGVNVETLGWVDNVSDFYNRITLYVQPSATEGFGIEVIEAMAHGRPVICSDQAGAADCVPESWRFVAGDKVQLSDKIALASGIVRHQCKVGPSWFSSWRDRASDYTWDKVRGQYAELWKEVISASEFRAAA